MRISDWSSDVCSSDLHFIGRLLQAEQRQCGVFAFSILPLMGKTSCRQPICLNKCLTGLFQITISHPLPRHISVGGAVDVVQVNRHGGCVIEGAQDRNSGGKGKRGSVRVDLGGGRRLKKKSRSRITSRKKNTKKK